MDSIEYYDQHADEFADQTFEVDMSSIRARFLESLPARADLLDVGCGAGRDSLAFSRAGHQVCAMDGSAALASIASSRTGLPVEVRRVESVDEIEAFDGIWCCASLLHVSEECLEGVFQRLWSALRPRGVLYTSFKYGTGSRHEEGRHFTDADEARLRSWVAGLEPEPSIECWLSSDARPRRTGQWLNALLTKNRAS